MKRKLITNWIALLLLTAMFSCSDDNSSKDDTDSGNLLERVAVDQSRVTIYSKDINTRASLPAIVIPDIPANAKTMYAAGEEWKAKSGDIFVLESGVNFNGSVKLDNNTYFVKGSLTLSGHYGSAGTIYVMPGGKLTLKHSPLANATIVSVEEIGFPNSYVINAGSTVITDHDITLSGHLQIGGKLHTTGHVNVGSLQAIKTAEVVFDNCVTVQNDFEITNSATVKVSTYLSVNKLELNSTNTLLLTSGSHISAKTVAHENPTTITNEGDDFAVIECGSYIAKQKDKSKVTGWIDIHTEDLQNHSGGDLAWVSNIRINGDTYIPAGECAPGFGTPPVKDVDTLYLIDHIAEVGPVKEKISATGVGFEGGKAYISWHKYGAPYEGYIDVIDMSPILIESTLHSDTLDFNHVNISDHKIYVAGGRKKGAFFGYVDYAANNIGLHLQKLNGSSGNCLLVDNNKIWAISGANGGLSIIEGERTEYKNMPFAKYVLKLNDQMVVLSGEKKAEDVIESKLSFFDLNENLVDEYVVGNITPIDGKNAMVTDGTTIYLALGRNGVKAFRNGQEVAAYNPGEIDAETGKVLTAANCVEVDDQYLYVANDKAGLYILDKTDLSLLCKYTLNGGASANFVKKADNGDIYVSYGLKGVNVFRLIVREVDNVAENVQ